MIPNNSKYLLDTHVWLWMNLRPNFLPEDIKGLLTNKSNQLFLSVVSVWEVSIKSKLGKLKLPDEIENFVNSHFQINVLQELGINRQHAISAGKLPAHHKDPFDRMLIAQAIQENLVLISADTSLKSYKCPLLSFKKQ